MNIINKRIMKKVAVCTLIFTFLFTFIGCEPTEVTQETTTPVNGSNQGDTTSFTSPPLVDPKVSKEEQELLHDLGSQESIDIKECEKFTIGIMKKTCIKDAITIEALNEQDEVICNKLEEEEDIEDCKKKVQFRQEELENIGTVEEEESENIGIVEESV